MTSDKSPSDLKPGTVAAIRSAALCLLVAGILVSLPFLPYWLTVRLALASSAIKLAAVACWLLLPLGVGIAIWFWRFRPLRTSLINEERGKFLAGKGPDPHPWDHDPRGYRRPDRGETPGRAGQESAGAELEDPARFFENGP